MVNERFSASAFDALGIDSKEAREHADLLAEEIQMEMHKVIFSHFEKIIKKLNEMGHNLKPYGEIRPGEISFRNDYEDENGYKCKLRVAIDTIVSTGYAHIIEPDQS